MLKKMSYNPSLTLGKEYSRRAELVGIQIQRTRVEIRREDLYKKKKGREKRLSQRGTNRRNRI